MSDPQQFGLGELGQRMQAMSDPAAPPAPTPGSAADPRLRPYQGAPLPIGSLTGRGPAISPVPTQPAATTSAPPPAASQIHSYVPREDLRTPPPPVAAPPGSSPFSANGAPSPFSAPAPAASQQFGQNPPRPFETPTPASSWEQVSIPAPPVSNPASGPAETAAHASDPASSPKPAASANSGESSKSGLQRVLDAVRSAIPVVQKLLPLLDGNFATAVGALMAPQHHPAPPPVQPVVQVDLEPVERGLAEVRNSNRELRTQVQEQSTTLKRVEDQLDRVREATDRNTLEQQELVEDLRAVGNRISTFAIIGVLLLLVSLGLNGYLIYQLQHILR